MEAKTTQQYHTLTITTDVLLYIIGSKEYDTVLCFIIVVLITGTFANVYLVYIMYIDFV